MNYETKTLPSGIIIENIPNNDQKYRWFTKGTHCIHNEVDPAIEYKNGNKHWFQHNNEHRLDGPAIEYADGYKFYYIDGFPYKEEEYWNHPKVKEFKYLKDHPELEPFV